LRENRRIFGARDSPVRVVSRLAVGAPSVLAVDGVRRYKRRNSHDR
jgi:hypothetical protein